MILLTGPCEPGPSPATVAIQYLVRAYCYNTSNYAFSLLFCSLVISLIVLILFWFKLL